MGRRDKETKRLRAASPHLFDDQDYYFDADAADRACEFFPRFLTFFQGREFAGQPFELAPWQSRDIVRPLFGWMRPDGRRKHRVCYVEVPRKSGKSNLAGGIALYLLTSDDEPGAEVYGAATDRPQARLVFRIAKKLARGNAAMEELLRVKQDLMEVPSTDSLYRVLSADVDNKDGLNASGIVFDEFHAQKDHKFYDVLKTSMGSRREPILFIITTAGYDLATLCGQYHEHAASILAGVVKNPFFLPVIYAAGKDDDPFDPATWHKANPGLGISVYEDFYHQEALAAKLLPSEMNVFKRLLLDIWTEAESPWMPLDIWDANTGELPGFMALRGRRCFVGLDLSSTRDLTALSLAFPRPEGGFFTFTWHFIPEDTIAERVRRDHVPYDFWVKEGWIDATPGNVTDYAFVKAKLRKLRNVVDIVEVAVDPWNATQLSTELLEEGFVIAPTRQGYATMSPAIKEYERLLLARKIVHGGNPVMRWQAGHAVVIEDPAGNKKLAKNKSREKIDGLVSTVMAIARACMHGEGTQSVYEIRGIDTVG